MPGESGEVGFGRQEPLLAQVVVALRCLATALEVQQGGLAHVLLEASPAKVESAEVPQFGSADQMPLARGYASPRDPLSEMGCLYFQREDCNQQWWDPFYSVAQPSGVPFFCDRGCVPEQFYFDKVAGDLPLPYSLDAFSVAEYLAESPQVGCLGCCAAEQEEFEVEPLPGTVATCEVKCVVEKCVRKLEKQDGHERVEDSPGECSGVLALVEFFEKHATGRYTGALGVRGVGAVDAARFLRCSSV